jgi:hypothetical protein
MKIKNVVLLSALGAAAIAPLAALGQNAPAAAATAPAPSSEAEQLRLQLNAQIAINQQLRARLENLQRRLALVQKSDGSMAPALDPQAAKPPVELESSDANSALEQALGAKGLELLPTGAFRITPAVSFSVAGSGASRIDSQGVSVGLDAGLPLGMMASARVPYVHRHADFGSNGGVGDFSLSLSKRFVNEGEGTPSVIGRLGYTHNNGRDPFEAIPIGGGFRSVDVSLSALKRLDPLVVYGTVSYAHSKPEDATVRDLNRTTVFQGRIAPGNSTGVSGGISLAATPDVSLDAGLTFNFFRDTRLAPTVGAPFQNSRHSEGYLTLGTGFVIKKDLFLTLNAAAGVTSESNKFIFSVALPYRF